MTMYTNEHEQWLAIKRWWKANGKWTVAIFLVAIISGFGVQYWQKSKLQATNEASMLYGQLLNGLQMKQLTQFGSIANNLEKNYSKTPYAFLSGLFQAEQAIQQGNWSLGQQKLQWAFEHAPSASLKQIAKLRVARILLAQGQGGQALKLIEKVEDPSFVVGINQVKGDIYLAQGNTSQARVAYEAAIKELPAGSPMRDYLQMLISSLRGA